VGGAEARQVEVGEVRTPARQYPRLYQRYLRAERRHMAPCGAASAGPPRTPWLTRGKMISAPSTKTLRCTPAMALGVTDHVWTIAELVAAAPDPQNTSPLPRPTPETRLKPGCRPFRPIVIRGGKNAVIDYCHATRIM